MSELSPDDRRWLDSAARLAFARLGTTGPFPAAAVLVVDETGQLLVGRGLTGAMGRPAALVAALADARGRTEAGTAYLTIEPDASEEPFESEAEKLAASGIYRAVVGTGDPDRKRKGRGIALLRARGVDVVVAEHEASRRLIEGYAMRVGHARPFVTAVLAVSADGMIAGRDGTQASLLSAPAAELLASQRLTADAVMTSARSLERNTQLLEEARDGAQPAHCLVVVSGRRAMPPGVAGGYRGILIVAPRQDGDGPGDDGMMRVDEVNGRLDLRQVLSGLAGRGINTVQVEAGARLTEGLVSAELVDRFQLLDSIVEVGRGGIPATPLGAIDARLRAAGLEQHGERLVGENRLRTFERIL